MKKPSFSRPNSDSCIVSIEFLCPKTKEQCLLKLSDVYFAGREGECEICGSHGSVDMTIEKCPSCGKEHKVILNEW